MRLTILLLFISLCGFSQGLKIVNGTVRHNGKVGIGITTPTSRLHLGAGTATAGTAPFKLTTGTALSSIEDGAIEYHSSHLYFSIGSTRYQLDQQSGGGGITIGTSAITSGTNTRVLYNNSGVVGEYSVSGSGSVAMTTNPLLTSVRFDNDSWHTSSEAANRIYFATGDATYLTSPTTVIVQVPLSATNLSGTNTGDQTTVSGNAGTATALQTARNIDGVSFNGTANIVTRYSGNFSQVGTATTTFTVTIGATMANSTYETVVTPTAALSAALFYVTNKTTTTFDVTYLAGLTGTVQFDYLVIP